MFNKYSKSHILGAVVGALFFIAVILISAWTLQCIIDDAVFDYEIEKSKSL